MNVYALTDDIVLQAVRLRQRLDVYTDHMLAADATVLARTAEELAGLLITRIPETPPCPPSNESGPKASTTATATDTRSAGTPTPKP